MSNQMTKEDSERIQSTQAKSGGDMSSDGFAARAQSAADRHHHAAANESAGSGAGAGTGADKAPEVVAGNDGESAPK